MQQTVKTLHQLSGRSGQLTESLGFRLAASRAYGDVLGERLASLHETPTNLGAGVGRFLSNRVAPALRTCTSIERRLSIVAEKIHRAIELLEVRIGLDLQTQNSAVLRVIAATAKSQFQLQRAVEGLSVIAMTYYCVGILGYVLSGPLEWLRIEKAYVLSISVPVTLVVVWGAIASVRRHLPGASVE